MENKNTYTEERFDSFLNKTIIMSSRSYFIKQMNFINKERTIFDDENYCAFLQEFINSSLSCIDKVDFKLQFNNAFSCLSKIEQAVIFLLYTEDFSQKDVAQILKLYAKTVSKIKIRAINKLRKYFEGDENYGK